MKLRAIRENRIRVVTPTMTPQGVEQSIDIATERVISIDTDGDAVRRLDEPRGARFTVTFLEKFALQENQVIASILIGLPAFDLKSLYYMLTYFFATTYFLGFALVACINYESEDTHPWLKRLIIFTLSPLIIPVLWLIVLQWGVFEQVLWPVYRAHKRRKEREEDSRDEQ